MNNDSRGTLVQQNNTMRINNALVENVSCSNNSIGRLLVSYSMPEDNQQLSIHNIQLNINNNTIIANSFGQNVELCRIQPGMFVNAIFSSRMTRSIPPQSNAFMIIVQNQFQEDCAVTTDRIASIDCRNNFIYTGNRNDINSQIRFTISNDTPITSRIGRPINLCALRPGQMVRITHATFMTASIPPQTAAYSVQLL